MWQEKQQIGCATQNSIKKDGVSLEKKEQTLYSTSYILILFSKELGSMVCAPTTIDLAVDVDVCVSQFVSALCVYNS